MTFNFAEDMKLFHSAQFYGEYFEIKKIAGDAEHDGTVETAILMTLLTDMRVNSEESYDGSTRGFWGKDLLGYNLGSKIWLLERSKLTNRTLRLFEQHTKDALQWLIDNDVYDELEVIAQRLGINKLGFFVALYSEETGIEKYKYEIGV